MPKESPFQINLGRDEQSQLQKMVRTYTSSYCDVIRAKVVLLAAQGMQNKDIAQRLDTSAQIVCKWRKRFFEQRLARVGRPFPKRPPRPFSPLR